MLELCLFSWHLRVRKEKTNKITIMKCIRLITIGTINPSGNLILSVGHLCSWVRLQETYGQQLHASLPVWLMSSPWWLISSIRDTENIMVFGRSQICSNKGQYRPHLTQLEKDHLLSSHATLSRPETFCIKIRRLDHPVFLRLSCFFRSTAWDKDPFPREPLSS